MLWESIAGSRWFGSSAFVLMYVLSRVRLLTEVAAKCAPLPCFAGSTKSTSLPSASSALFNPTLPLLAYALRS